VDILEFVLQVVLGITSLLLTLLILLHKGRGGGLSDMFGGGMSSALGSGLAERNLNRFTVVLALVWFVAIVALGLITKFQGQWQPAETRAAPEWVPDPWASRTTAGAPTAAATSRVATRPSATSPRESRRRRSPKSSIRRTRDCRGRDDKALAKTALDRLACPDDARRRGPRRPTDAADAAKDAERTIVAHDGVAGSIRSLGR
jgi:preprotein translocase subunit SecG